MSKNKLFAARLPVEDHARDRLAVRRYSEDRWHDHDLTHHAVKTVARPCLTWGPWHFFDLAASTTTDGVVLMPTAAATLSTNSNAFPAPAAGRVVGASITTNQDVVSGTLSVQAKVGSTYTTVGGTVLTSGHAGADWLSWDAGVPFEKDALIEAAILTASLNPSGSMEARVVLYLMLDVLEGIR